MKTNKLLLICSVFMIFSFTKINAQDDAWVAPEDAKSIENTVAEKKRKSSAGKGEKIYQKRCVFCHGQAGLGDGGAAARLNPKPANLTSERVQSQADGEIFWKITKGKGSMPKWEAIISESDRWNLVNYIRTLSKE